MRFQHVEHIFQKQRQSVDVILPVERLEFGDFLAQLQRQQGFVLGKRITFGLVGIGSAADGHVKSIFGEVVQSRTQVFDVLGEAQVFFSQFGHLRGLRTGTPTGAAVGGTGAPELVAGGLEFTLSLLEAMFDLAKQVRDGQVVFSGRLLGMLRRLLVVATRGFCGFRRGFF